MKTTLKTTPSRKLDQRRRGAMSVEYLAILGAIVIPLALTVPMLINMIVIYTHRVLAAVGSPFG